MLDAFCAGFDLSELKEKLAQRFVDGLKRASKDRDAGEKLRSQERFDARERLDALEQIR